MTISASNINFDCSEAKGKVNIFAGGSVFIANFGRWGMMQMCQVRYFVSFQKSRGEEPNLELDYS